MDISRLRLLLELSRLGSMQDVAVELRTSTSTVSQGIAALARDVGTPLIEPDGRRVRLTPAGHRLAEHAVTIIAAVDAARGDLDPSTEPVGAVRVAGFATAIRRSLVPVIDDLATRHPGLQVRVHEYEPAEALDLLARDDVDLALVYDYNLAPERVDPAFAVEPLWETDWGLAVPATQSLDPGLTAVEVFAHHRDRDWIGNPRNSREETVLRVVAAMAGFEPRITHYADSLDLVDDLVRSGAGVGLLPMARRLREGITLIPLRHPSVTMRTFAWVKKGRQSWPPLRLALTELQRASYFTEPLIRPLMK